MRTPVLVLGLMLFAAPASALTIQATKARAHVGQTATVEGTVSVVHHARSGGAIFLDIDGRYPRNAFSAVIFSRNAKKFKNVDALNGKTVDVTGAIRLYKGKPEIVLSNPNQLKVK